jgi:signal recognition particle GTPase
MLKNMGSLGGLLKAIPGMGKLLQFDLDRLLSESLPYRIKNDTI